MSLVAPEMDKVLNLPNLEYPLILSILATLTKLPIVAATIVQMGSLPKTLNQKLSKHQNPNVKQLASSLAEQWKKIFNGTVFVLCCVCAYACLCVCACMCVFYSFFVVFF
jgi:hypothetical protein